jgi:hypothetical protein
MTIRRSRVISTRFKVLESSSIRVQMDAGCPSVERSAIKLQRFSDRKQAKRVVETPLRLENECLKKYSTFTWPLKMSEFRSRNF